MSGSLPPGFKLDAPPSGADENVGLGTQTLFDMASGDPATQKRVLTKFYGDNVGQDQTGFYVTENGKRLRPSASGGGFSGAMTRGTASVLSQALPVVAATGGAAAGSATSGLGGIAGGALGYAGGSWANRGILALAGVSDSEWGSLGQVPGDLASGAAFEAGGQVLGRVAGQTAAALKVGGQYAAEALGLPALLRNVGSVTKETAERWMPLAEKGVNLPPQVAFPGAPILPMLSSIGKRYDIDPVTPSLKKYATGEIEQTANALGIPKAELGKPLERTAEIDYTPAGEALHKKYTEMLTASNAELNTKFDAAEKAVRGQGAAADAERKNALAGAQMALEANQSAARSILNAGWQDIRHDIARLRSGQMPDGTPVEGGNPGDLVRTMAGRVQAWRQALDARYQDLYGKWNRVYGGRVADTGDITDAADAFRKDLPDDIARNHPALVRALDSLKPSEDSAEGVTVGQLRHIRSMLGEVANWNTLAPSFSNGTLKYFRGVVDKSLKENVGPEGAKALSTIDKGYADDFAPFNHKSVQRLVDWTGANPRATGGYRLGNSATSVASEVMADEAEPRSYVKGLMGTKVWDAVVGADMQAALDASKSIYPGEIDGARFVREFEHRDRLGVLADYPPETAAKLRQQAQYVSEITDGGKTPLPLSVQRGDTFTKAMQNAYDAAKRVKTLSEADPLKAMTDEVKRLSKQRTAELRTANEQYSTDPLGKELTNPNALLSNSAHKIIRDPQLLTTAAKRFGRESPEFQLLSRTYIKDVLTRPDVYGLAGLSNDVTKLTRDQQELIFGAKADDIILFGKNVKDILEAVGRTDAGSSIIASTAVTHPLSTPLPGMAAARKSVLGMLPAGVLRVPIGKVLEYTIKGYTNPAFFKFVAGALRSSPEEQALARSLIKRFTLGGGIAGEAAGSIMATLPGGNTPAPPPPPPDWRQQFKQRYGQ